MVNCDNINYYILCRFVPESSNDSYADFPNFSSNRKVRGYLSIFNLIGKTIAIISTSTAEQNIGYPQRVDKLESPCAEIFVPSSIQCPFRLLRYLYSIVQTTIKLRIIKKKQSKLILWNITPDTLLPLIFSGFPLRDAIFDIEERITSDPEASLFFRWFERIFIRVKPGGYFVSNSSIVLPHRTIPKVEFNGFYSISIAEELYIKNLFSINGPGLAKSNNFTVVYASRFDSNRGAHLLIDIFNDLKLNVGPDFHFIIFGFGDRELIDKIQSKAPPFVSFKIGADRQTYITDLCSCNCALNILLDSGFKRESFPSKLVEYSCLAPLILSNMSNPISQSRTVVESRIENLSNRILSLYYMWRDSVEDKEYSLKLTEMRLLQKCFSLHSAKNRMEDFLKKFQGL
jgi:glycosyltransferase involved in cell wall biosynthesis